MTDDRKREIEKQAEAIIKLYDLEKDVFIDISSILKKDGFQIKRQKMPISTSGCLIVDGNEKVIVVNTVFPAVKDEEDVAFKKSRFIAAHEYGHYKLHCGKDETSYFHHDSDKREEEPEQEADYFARCILMPKKYFLSLYDIIKKLNGDNEEIIVNVLSKFFRVTKKKVRARKEELLG